MGLTIVYHESPFFSEDQFRWLYVIHESLAIQIRWEFQDPKIEVLTVSYKTSFWGYIPLHNPYIGFIYIW